MMNESIWHGENRFFEKIDMEEQTKHCPYCGEEIQATAKKCRYCGEWLDGEHENHNETPKNEEGGETNDDERKGWIEYFFIDTLFKHYADFNSTVGRKQFWLSYAWLSLFLVAIMSLEVLAAGNIFVKFASPSYLLTSIATLAVLVPFIAACVRRLRDAGLHWAWMSLYAVSFILSIADIVLADGSSNETTNMLLGLSSMVSLLSFIALVVLLCKKGSALCAETKVKVVDIVVLALCALLCLGGVAKAAWDYKRVTDLVESLDSLSSMVDSEEVANDEGTPSPNKANSVKDIALKGDVFIEKPEIEILYYKLILFAEHNGKKYYFPIPKNVGEPGGEGATTPAIVIASSNGSQQVVDLDIATRGGDKVDYDFFSVSSIEDYRVIGDKVFMIGNYLRPDDFGGWGQEVLSYNMSTGDVDIFHGDSKAAEFGEGNQVMIQNLNGNWGTYYMR